MRKNRVSINKIGVEKLQEIERKGNNVLLLCKCPLCGNTFTMWRSHFYRGSNGCNCVHPISERLYSIWTNMKTRCFNKNNPNYNYIYGSKGIVVCNEWKNSYKAFEAWAIANGYNDSLTIDRIDNTKGYYPDNCRWATYLQQNHNRRSTVRFTLRGRLLTAKECADSIHIPYKTLMNKYYHKGKEATELYIQNKYKDRIKQLKGGISCT